MITINNTNQINDEFNTVYKTLGNQDLKKSKLALMNIGYSEKEIEDLFKESEVKKFGAVVDRFMDKTEYIKSDTISDGDYKSCLRKCIAKNMGPVILRQSSLNINKINNYLEEWDKFNELVNQCKDVDVKKIGSKLINEMEMAQQQGSLSHLELKAIISTASTAISNPSFYNAEGCIAEAKKLFPRPKTQIIGGLLLALGGLTLIAASTAICAVSFGILSPVSIGGFMIGASLVHAGAAIAAGVWGLGMAAGGGFKMFDKKPIRKHLEELGKKVSKNKTPR